MRHRQIAWFIFIGSLLLAGWSFLVSPHHSAPPTEWEMPSGLALISGEPGESPPLARIINLFASWCTPCLAELPELQQLQQNSDIPILGIAVDKNARAAIDWLGEHGNPFDEVYHDPESLSLRLNRVVGLPETFLVDSADRVVWHHRGPITQSEYKKLLEKLEAMDSMR